MKKITSISLFIFFCVTTAILTAGLVFYQNKNNSKPNGSSVVATGTNLPSGTILNIAEVSKHNTNSDCWIVVNNKVYNISDYASSHPGGARNILNSCGKESTQAFNTKGGTGSPHSPSANSMLVKFYVGDLNQVVGSNLPQQTTQTNQNNSSVVSTGTTKSSASSSSSSSTTSLDLAEVSKHNTNADCWIIVNSKVYNISNYASSHPGGSRNILNNCGKEATQAFNTKGGTGSSHSPSANAMLANFYVGDFNQTINSAVQQNIQKVQSNPIPAANQEFDD